MGDTKIDFTGVCKMRKVTREQLNNLLEQTVDEKLKVVTEQPGKDKNGILSKLIQFVNYMKKNENFNKALAIYLDCSKKCEKNSKSYKYKDDPISKLGKASEKDISEMKDTYEKLIKSEVQVAESLLNCRYELVNSLVKLLEKNGDKICKKSKDEDKCNKWLSDNLEDMKSDLEYIEEGIKMVKKAKNDKQKEKILTKLSNSIL